MPNHKTVTFDVELRRIAHELRTYNPQADEYHGEHIHKVWAKEIDALLAAPTPAAQSAGQEALFWYRPCADGLYEGPHHANSKLGMMLRAEKPEAWKPLFTEQQTAGVAHAPDSDGWEWVRVKNLQPLLDALARAEEKGYMPDAFIAEWAALEIARAAPVNASEPVGVAGTMPGTEGFTMACFEAAKVPVGTSLYAAPVNGALQEPVYQTQRIMGGWDDITQAEFGRTHESRRRIVYAAPVNGGEREEAYEPYSASDFTKLVAENAGLKLNVQRLEKRLLELNEELHVADLEREHFGDPDKRTGICGALGADAPQVGEAAERWATYWKAKYDALIADRAAEAQQVDGRVIPWDLACVVLNKWLEKNCSSLGAECESAFDAECHLFRELAALTSPAKEQK